MGEYAKPLGLIMAVEQQGFSAELRGNRSTVLVAELDTFLPPLPNTQSLDKQVAQALGLAFDILDDAATLEPMNSAPSKLVRTIPGKGRYGIGTIILQWDNEPKFPGVDVLSLPWHGNDAGTNFGISIEVNPNEQTVAVLRKASPDILRYNGEGMDIMLPAFVRQPKLLLSAVARALNATINRENQDR